MLRQSIVKVASSATRLNFRSRSAFTTTAHVMAGETGAPPRTGGQGDAFQKREKAAEDMAIRQREIEKLHELRAKLDQQETHLKELKNSIDEIAKEQGGEHN